MGNSRVGESSLFQEVGFYSPNCACWWAWTSHISSIFPQRDDIPCPHGQSHWPGIESSGSHRGPSPKSHKSSKPYSGWWACGKLGPHHSFRLRHLATRHSPVRPDPRPGCRMGLGWCQALKYERPLCTFLHLGLQFCSYFHLSPRSHREWGGGTWRQSQNATPIFARLYMFTHVLHV